MDLNASFANRLTQRCRKVGSHLCVGFDPRPDRIPSELIAASSSETTAIADFGRAVIDLVGPLSAAIKFQSAFFEVFGTSGLQVMDELAAHAQACGLITIADIKRADIGSTAEAYARASLGTGHKNTAFDAITVNPWFGSDGVMPFFKRAATMGKGVFVLVRTSNPSSAELLELPLSESSGGGKVFERVAELVKEWGNSMRRSDEESPLVAAVVGATHAEELEHLRAMMPNTWFLVPGVGAQGATMADAAHAFDSEGSRALVALSRGITEPWGKGPAPIAWKSAIESAVKQWNRELDDARKPSR